MPHPCARCRIRRHADHHPDGLIARLWRWHARWCPGWRSYQRSLSEAERQQDGNPR